MPGRALDFVPLQTLTSVPVVCIYVLKRLNCCLFVKLAEKRNNVSENKVDVQLCFDASYKTELKRDKFPTGHQCLIDSHGFFFVNFLVK